MKKDFIRYIGKVLLFILIVVIVDVLSGVVLRKIQQASFERNPLRFEVRAMYAIEKGNAKIAIIGASDASHSYISKEIEDSLGLTTFNYGKDGCFFVYQNCLINLMLERYTPKVIIWEIGKSCLSEDEVGDSRQWQSISDFYPYYDRNKYCHDVINRKGRFQQLYMYSSLYRYNSKLLTILEPFISNESVPKTNGYVPLPNTGYLYPEYHVSKTPDSIDPWKVELLIGTLDKLRDKNVLVIFSFAPGYGENGGERTTQYKKLTEMAKVYGVSMIDYQDSPVFMSDSTLFKDARHLNDKGAKFYMEYFIPELKTILEKQ